MNGEDRLILLIEDDPSDARLIQRAFQKANITMPVTRLPNGDDAVAYLAGSGPYENRRNHPLPSMIVLDVKLPRRSGFEVLRWLRSRNDPLRRIPVVMLTSSRHTVDVDRAYDLGANSYLTKPDTSDALTNMLLAFSHYWFFYNEQPTL